MTVLAFVRPTKVGRILAIDTAPSSPMSQPSLNGFGNAVISVTSYCNAARASALLPPLPGNVPAWYPTLNTNLQNMKGHAQIWLDTIGPSMTAIPQAIINYDNKFEGQYATIVALLTQIGTNPPTPQQKTDLLTEMNALLAYMQGQHKVISDSNDALIAFNNNLSTDHTALTTGAASVTAAIQSDQADVKAMKIQIDALHKAVDALNQQVTFSAIGIGGGLFVALIGVFLTIATVGAGAFVVVLGVAGAVASIGTLIAAEVEIQQANDRITAASAELSTDNQQITVLNSVSTTMDMLMKKNSDAMTSMTTILTDWATLTGKLQGVIDDLNTAEGDIGSILDLGDMATTKAAWTQLAAFAQNMQNGLGNVTVDPTVTPIKAA
jgi:hypothetical protein